jgi:hypothetical protein
MMRAETLCIQGDLLGFEGIPMKWALLVLFAALPLQWYVVPGPGPVSQRLHLVVLVLFTMLVLARFRGSAFVPVLSMTWSFVVANVALVMVWCATAFYHSESVRSPLEEGILIVVFLAVATVIHRGCVDPSSGVLQHARWAAAVAAVSLLLALAASLAVNGVNPAAAFGRMLATGDTRILGHEVFKSAFAGFGFDATTARANMRHEAFGAVLVAMYVSMTAVRLYPLSSARARNAYRASIVLATLMILLSLSRSVTIAAAAIPVLAVVRTLRSGRLSTRQIALAGAMAAGAAVLVVLGVSRILWDRFTQDTSSYQARDVLLHQAVSNIGEHALTGGVSTVGGSSHNLVLDSWLRSGLFGAAFAAFILLLVVGVWFVLVVGLPRAPDWMFPVTAALALPVIRMLTAGGGLIPPVEWVCLAVVAGFLRHRLGLGSQGVWHSPREVSSTTPR